jgi:hypothetical protein
MRFATVLSDSSCAWWQGCSNKLSPGFWYASASVEGLHRIAVFQCFEMSVMCARHVSGLGAVLVPAQWASIAALQASSVMFAWCPSHVSAPFSTLVATVPQVPVALAAGMYVYNTHAAEPLTLTEEASLFGGFLSFKAAHVLYIYQQLRPRFNKKPRKRPTFDSVPDIEYDLYGREKVQAKGVQEAEKVLAQEEERKANGWLRW